MRCATSAWQQCRGRFPALALLTPHVGKVLPSAASALKSSRPSQQGAGHQSPGKSNYSLVELIYLLAIVYMYVCSVTEKSKQARAALKVQEQPPGC